MSNLKLSAKDKIHSRYGILPESASEIKQRWFDCADSTESVVCAVQGFLFPICEIPFLPLQLARIAVGW
jgi:hypothetical protein